VTGTVSVAEVYSQGSGKVKVSEGFLAWQVRVQRSGVTPARSEYKGRESYTSQVRVQSLLELHQPGQGTKFVRVTPARSVPELPQVNC